MDRRPQEEAFGLFASERAIMDLHDAGKHPRDIAKELGKRVRYVDAVIKNFDGKGDDSWMQRDRGATIRLALAISCYRGPR